MQVLLAVVVEKGSRQQWHPQLVVPVEAPSNIFLGEDEAEDLGYGSLNLQWLVLLHEVSCRVDTLVHSFHCQFQVFVVFLNLRYEVLKLAQVKL